MTKCVEFIALLLVAVVAVAPVQKVLALQCYSCSSLQDPNCWNVSLLSPSQVQGCEGLYYACTTRVTRMDDFAFIGRNCLPKGICENTINVDGGIEDRCVTCDTDFCNTGSGAAAAAAKGVDKIIKWRFLLTILSLVVIFTVVNVN